MSTLWWLGLGLMLLPIWWHRQKRQSTKAAPLATARFLPRAEPKQRRVWRWVEIILLLLRCLMIAAVTAWLADLVIAWRGDTQLQPAKENAGDPLRWLAAHEREFKKDARISVAGDAPMPAARPAFQRQVTLATAAAAKTAPTRHVYIESAQRERWIALFKAAEGPVTYTIDEVAGPGTHLVVWDSEAAPPAQLRAPLWWTAKATAGARKLEWQGTSFSYSDSPAGRALQSTPLLPASVDQARALFSAWEYIAFGAAPYTAPPGSPDAKPHAASVQPLPVEPAPGPLRESLAWIALALFALERIFAHAGKR